MKKTWMALAGILLYGTTVYGTAAAQTKETALLPRITPDGACEIEGQEFSFQIANDNWKWNPKNRDTMIPDAPPQRPCTAIETAKSDNEKSACFPT